MYKEILEKDEDFNSYRANDLDQIEKIKQFLGGLIPNTYLQYLIEIGSGGTATFDIEGTGGEHTNGIPTLIIANERRHNNDKELPKEYIFLMNLGEDISYYFDTSSKDQDGEYKVVGWISGLTREEQPKWLKDQYTFKKFYEFFKKRAIEAGLL